MFMHRLSVTPEPVTPPRPRMTSPEIAQNTHCFSEKFEDSKKNKPSMYAKQGYVNRFEEDKRND